MIEGMLELLVPVTTSGGYEEWAKLEAEAGRFTKLLQAIQASNVVAYARKTLAELAAEYEVRPKNPFKHQNGNGNGHVDVDYINYMRRAVLMTRADTKKYIVESDFEWIPPAPDTGYGSTDHVLAASIRTSKNGAHRRLEYTVGITVAAKFMKYSEELTNVVNEAAEKRRRYLREQLDDIDGTASA
jgi:hypothetical protein